MGSKSLEGSEGSEGSKGSKGCGIALAGDEFYSQRYVLSFLTSTVILSDSEGSRYLNTMRQMPLNTGRQEGRRLAVTPA